MNKPITIGELQRNCLEEIKKGHEDYTIMISDDDEGNGFHYLWYAFTPVKDIGYIAELNEDIAPQNETVILG